MTGVESAKPSCASGTEGHFKRSFTSPNAAGWPGRCTVSPIGSGSDTA